MSVQLEQEYGTGYFASAWTNAVRNHFAARGERAITSSKEGIVLDHIFLTVGDIERSIALYSATLQPLGMTQRLDYDGLDGPSGHPDLKGFGAKGRMFF
jgi:hypothetical protein